MPAIETVVAVALAGFALSATPGPSMLYVLSRSVGQSREAGLASALGLGLGGVLLAVATALGLAAIFAAFDWLVSALTIVGSLYLVWLGAGMILAARRAAHERLEIEAVQVRPFSEIVRQGIVVELLNPKTVLFFALFLPPFVDETLQASVTAQLLILGSLVPLTAVPSDLLLAWMGGTISKAMNERGNIREALAWIGGITLLAIALNLHLEFI